MSLMIYVLLSVVTLLTGSGIAASAEDVRPPNIVIIYADDMGFGDAGCQNLDARFKTPALDRLAREGIRFTNAHCADTVCTPSRYGLLTGRYCWRTVMKTGVLGAEADCLIADGRMTVASLLRDNGYRTAMVGKWHLGMDFPGKPGHRDWSEPVVNMPLDKGFEYFYGIPASLNFGVLAWFEGRFAKVPPILFTAKKPNRRHIDYRIMPPYQQTPEEAHSLAGRQTLEVAADFVDNQCLTRFTDRALAWIGQQTTGDKRNQPFFLYLPLTSPHYPVCPLPKFHGQGACGAYGEFLIETDHHIGRLLQYLDQTGLAHNTLIIFSSDNGPERSWKQRLVEYQHDSNGPFRGGKRDIYEGGHRVPFLVRWPNGISTPGREWTGLICQTDILATIADIIETELPTNAGEDSQSFASVLASPSPQHNRLPLISHGAKGRFAVTDGQWKLIMAHGDLGEELYDLSTDPGETTNIISSNPKPVAALKAVITNIVCQGRTTPGPKQSNDTGYWDDLSWITAAEYSSE